jgi:hypothetical protein
MVTKSFITVQRDQEVRNYLTEKNVKTVKEETNTFLK